jgi:predicted lipid-binding transport protein (Tim44 family)
MRRKVFDVLASLGGLVVVVMLVVAGGLAMWGYSFANSSVHTQLAQQQIAFPAKGSEALASPEIGPYLNKYAGQNLTTGAQAKAYADHFIAVHLSEMPLGGVYSKVSAASRANPNDAKLAAEVQTSFQGTTLRGLLLEAYAFSVFATIALWAGIASFVLAALLLILVGFGFWHARRVPETAEILPHAKATKTPVIA